MRVHITKLQSHHLFSSLEGTYINFTDKVLGGSLFPVRILD